MLVTTNVAIGVTLVLWALIPIFDKLGLSGEKVPPLAGMIVRVVAALLAFVPLALFSPEVRTGVATMSWRAIAIFAASGLVSLVVAQYFYYVALTDRDAGRLFPVLFGGAPIIGILLAALFLGEKITLKVALGGTLIAIGSALMF